jgi:5-deoxy-glucuronate isomerase
MAQMATVPQFDKMVFRKTDARIGRHISVTPGNSTNKHLSYGRIRLNADTPAVSFADGEQETGLLVLKGEAIVQTAGKEFSLGQYDALYIPRDSKITVKTNSLVDIAEFSAPVANKYPLQYVNFAEMCKDPGLKFDAGVGTGAARHLHMSCAKNVQAGRIVFGWTYSDPGNWTSWPPHEHTEMLEEMYVYFDMPAPAFGLQLVYNNTEYPELIVPVREGDAVLMPSGYHPNVSVPGHKICFIWAMAAHREVEDRKFGVVNVQPGFNQGGSGLEKGKAK